MWWGMGGWHQGCSIKVPGLHPCFAVCSSFTSTQASSSSLSLLLLWTSHNFLSLLPIIPSSVDSNPIPLLSLVTLINTEKEAVIFKRWALFLSWYRIQVFHLHFNSSSYARKSLNEISNFFMSFRKSLPTRSPNWVTLNTGRGSYGCQAMPSAFRSLGVPISHWRRRRRKVAVIVDFLACGLSLDKPWDIRFWLRSNMTETPVDRWLKALQSRLVLAAYPSANTWLQITC